MPLPANTLPMMTGTGPFGPIEMGGMFTVMKVREDLAPGDYRDPGWYQHPQGTVAARGRCRERGRAQLQAAEIGRSKRAGRNANASPSPVTGRNMSSNLVRLSAFVTRRATLRTAISSARGRGHRGHCRRSRGRRDGDRRVPQRHSPPRRSSPARIRSSFCRGRRRLASRTASRHARWRCSRKSYGASRTTRRPISIAAAPRSPSAR